MGWVSAERSDTSLSLGLKKERWRLLTGLLVTVAVICLTKLLFRASGVTALVFLMVYLVRLCSPRPPSYTKVSEIAEIGERILTFQKVNNYFIKKNRDAVF